MNDKHSPTDVFRQHLENEIRGSVRRRRSFGQERPVRAKGYLIIVATLCVSLAGTSGVILAQELEGAAEKKLQLLRAEAAVQIADERVAEARRTEGEVKKLYAAGLCGEAEVTRATLTRKAAETRAAQRRLDVAEIRETGRQPRNDLTAPLVAGRDFVVERLRLDLTLAEFVAKSRATALANLARLHAAKLVSQTEFDSARRTKELSETAAQRVEQRLQLRTRFQEGKLHANRVALWALRDDARLDKKAAEIKLAAARKELSRLTALHKAASATRNDLRAAQASVRQLEAAIRMAERQIEITTEGLRK